MSEISSLSRNAFIREFREGLDISGDSALGKELRARGYDLDGLDEADGRMDGMLSGDVALGLLFDLENGARGDRHKPRLSSRGDEGRLLRAAHASKVHPGDVARVEDGRLSAHVNGPVAPPVRNPAADLSLQEIEALAYEHYLAGDVNKLVDLLNGAPGDIVGATLMTLVDKHGEPTTGRRGLGALDPTLNSLLHRIRSHGSIETQARAAEKLMARISKAELGNPQTAQNYPLMVHATKLMQHGDVAVRAHDHGGEAFERAFSMMPNYMDAGLVPGISKTFDHIIASSVEIRTQRMIRGEDTFNESTKLGFLTGAAASGIERLHQRGAQAQQMLAHMIDVELTVISAMTGQVAKGFLPDPKDKGVFEVGRAFSPSIDPAKPEGAMTVTRLLKDTASLIDTAIASDAVGPVYHRADGTADLSAYPDLAVIQTKAKIAYERGFNEAAAKYLR